MANRQVEWLRVGSFALALAVLAAGPATADEDHEARNRASFRVESVRQVANDWTRAVVGVLVEDADPARAADQVNRTMAWALDAVRAEKRVEARSGGYHTQPVYDEGRVRRWRASQELVLETGDAAAMTTLLGTLQERLELRSFLVTVSETRRREVEAELVSEVLAAFRQRAALVSQGLGAKSWKLDDVAIDTGGTTRPPQPRMEMARSSSARVAPPAVESGTSRISVTARGSIVLE